MKKKIKTNETDIEENSPSGISSIVPKTVTSNTDGTPIDYSAASSGNMIAPFFKMGKNSISKELLGKLSELIPEVTDEKQVYVKIEDMVFVCLNQKNLPIELQDKKFLLNLMQRFSEINTYNEPDMNVIDKKRYFDYPVEAFAELLGWKYNEENRRNVVKELKKSIYHLDSYRLVATDVAIKKAKDKRITKEEFQTIPILGGVTLQRITEEALSEAGTENKEKKLLKVEKGCIRISLSMELAKYLNIAPIAYYPPELKETKNPVSFYIGYDLITHFNTNEICHHFKNGKVRKISSILEKCTDLPKYEYVKEHQGRKYFEKIINPFCKALTELKSFDISICQKNEKGEYEPLDSLFLDIQNGIYDFFKGYNFEKFLDLYIVFAPKNYPKKISEPEKKAISN